MLGDITVGKNVGVFYHIFYDLIYFYVIFLLLNYDPMAGNVAVEAVAEI
jgi:hypothetical protein